MQRNFQFFSQSGCKHHWGWVLDNTTRLSSYMKNTVSCSCWKLLLSQFNIQKIRYGEKGFRSIFHVRRNLRISSTVSYFNILLSTIFQVYLLSNKECFSRICDISGTSERILVRITCNSRQTILSCCFELKRENTSRDRKISFEIWRYSKYGGSNYGKSLIIVCWEFSLYQRNSSNKRDVQIMGSRIIESQLYEIF